MTVGIGDMASRRRARGARSARLGRWVRALASLGVWAGLLLAAATLAAGARPVGGVPPWAWLALACACLLVRDAAAAPPPVRRGRPPR